MVVGSSYDFTFITHSVLSVNNCSLPIVNGSLHLLQKATAQTNTTTTYTSSEGTKVLVDDAIEALKNKDVNKAVVHLNILNQQLPTLGNLSSIQSVKVLLDDATSALKNGDTCSFELD